MAIFLEHLLLVSTDLLDDLVADRLEVWARCVLLGTSGEWIHNDLKRRLQLHLCCGTWIVVQGNAAG